MTVNVRGPLKAGNLGIRLVWDVRTCRLVNGYCLPVTGYLITVYQSTVRSVLEDWNIQLLFLFASQFDLAEVGPV